METGFGLSVIQGICNSLVIITELQHRVTLYDVTHRVTNSKI